MVTVYDLKPAFQARLRGFAARLVASGRTANQVTLVALALAALVGAALLSSGGHWLVLLVLPPALLLRMALNAIDGIMAREHGQQSRFGALLNEVGDLTADALMYLPLAIMSGPSSALLVAAVTCGLIAEGAGLAVVQLGAQRGYQGPMGKSDRAVAFALFAALAALGAPAWLLDLVSMVILIGGILTIVNRLRVALHATEGR